MKLIKSGIIQRSKIKHSKKYSIYSLPITPVEENLIYDDIFINGQVEPVQLDEDYNLLDGYLRDRLLGKMRQSDIRYERHSFEDEDEKIKHILSLNRMRRHYTEYQKCQMAVPIYKEEQKKAAKRQIEQGKKNEPLGPKDLKGTATSIAAKAAGTSGSTFKRFLEIQKSPELEKYEPALIKGDKKIRTVHVLVTRKERNLPKVPLPEGEFDIFLTDVPIGYDDTGGRAAAEEHYPTMSAKEIAELKIPTAKNAIMFFWMSPSIMYDEVNIKDGAWSILKDPTYKYILDSWEFKVKAEFVWDKEKIGVGSYNRGQHENLLMAMKGDMPIPAELFSSIIKQLRTKHSKKPDLWPMIKKMYPQRKYCELFSRQSTPGVTSHGNQVK